MNTQSCPCGNNRPYHECCAIFIEQNLLPKTAQQLMRSRYTAYVRCDLNYLITSWHQSSKPEELKLSELDKTKWCQLYIIKTSLGMQHDEHGSVEFVAYFINNHSYEKLHEVSQFSKEKNKWFYIDGKIINDSNFQPGRNSPCYCGSGKKYKQCCLTK